MSTEPASLATLLRALRAAAAALEAGMAPEEVRSVLRPHVDALRDGHAHAGATEEGDGKRIRALLRENDLLSRTVIRLSLDAQVLLEVLAQGAGPGQAPASPDRGS